MAEIIQGTNKPITVTFAKDVSTFKKIVATMWEKSDVVMTWEKGENMIVDDDTIYLPITEDKSRTLKRGTHKLDIKGLNADDQIEFWEEVDISVRDRRDRDVDLIEGE